MNTRFRLTLINNLNNNQRGFSVPMVLIMGMVTIAVGITFMVNGQANQSQVVAQKNTSRSASFAETGITKYMDFLNNNRTLLTYPDCVGTKDINGVCPDTSQQSWFAASNIPNLPSPATTTSSSGSTSTSCSSFSSGSSSDSNVSSASDISAMANTSSTGANSGWKDLSDGQYRLVSYSYASAGSGSGGTGTLVIEGRINQTSTGASATTVPTSKSRIAVNFPVTVGTTSTSGASYAGFWAQDFTFTNTSAKVYANVRDASGCLTGGKTFPTSYLATNSTSAPTGTLAAPYQAKTEAIAFPDLPYNNTYPATDPTGVYVNQINSTNANGCDHGSMPLGVQYPRAGIDKDSNGNFYNASTSAPNAKYYYRLGDCSGGKSISNSGSLNITLGQSGQETIYLFVDAKISQSNSGGIIPYTNSTTNSTTHVIMYANGNATPQITLTNSGSISYDPKAFQLYYYGTGSISLTNTGSINGFVFAPYGTLILTNQGGINGAAWVKSFKDSNQGNIYQSITDFSGLEVQTTSSTSNNFMGSVTSWKQQATN